MADTPTKAPKKAGAAGAAPESPSRADAANRPLQGPHSNHDPSSGNPDRDVNFHEETVAAGQPAPLTDLSDGTPQGERNRDVQLTDQADGTPQLTQKQAADEAQRASTQKPSRR